MEWTFYLFPGLFCLFGLLAVVRLYFKLMGKPVSNYDLDAKLDRALKHLHLLRSEVSSIRTVSMFDVKRINDLENQLKALGHDVNASRDEIFNIASKFAEAETVVLCKAPESELIG